MLRSAPTKLRELTPAAWALLTIWAASLVSVLVIGLHYIPLEYPNIGRWATLYHTLRLFVFEFDLPHFPHSPPLVAVHFLAPLVALSALWTAVLRMLDLSPVFLRRKLKDHVLVCGVGRVGSLLAEAVVSRGVPVVGVDLGPPESFAHKGLLRKVFMVFGNFHSQDVLMRAGATKARSILFASGDDLANLEGALGAYGWLRSMRTEPAVIWAHIADEKLAETACSIVRTEGLVRVRFFDTFRIAATKVIRQYFNPEIRRGVRLVTVIGFGKFGHDILELLLQGELPDEKFEYHIVDKRDLSSAVRSLAAEYGAQDRVSFIHANIHDMVLRDESDRAFFLCTDDDLGNLTGAMMLAERLNANHIFVRMANWPVPAIAEQLGQERGVRFININQLVQEGLEELPCLFERCTPEQLGEHACLHE